MKTETTLETLLQSIQQGDKDAIGEVYELTDQAVFSFILSIVKNYNTAQDLMQETYLKIRESIHSYKPRGKPMGWILTIAKNLAYMSLRSQKKELLIDYTEEENAEIATTPSSDERIVDNMVLHNALKHLSDIERQTVILHAIAGLKHREIATLLNQPLGTILWRYNQALKKLRLVMA